MTNAAPSLSIHQIPGQAEFGTVEIHGVAADVFNPAIWEKGTLHLLPDQRMPLMAPQQTGVFRNIYAPSAVETPQGWRVFYGAWDGVRSGNDRIYSFLTGNFIDFQNRQCVIEHGPFIHTCNVNAIGNETGGFDLVCTAYPVGDNLNKPIFFSSPDGKLWNGAAEPYAAQTSDLMTIHGYDKFDTADMNGINVLLKEDGKYRLYFGNFKDWGHIYRASGTDGKNFQFEGSTLDAPHMVNDVKKIMVDGKAWYLMGNHANGDHLWYALSNDGMTFGPEKVLAKNLGDADRYMVALGWVMRGNRVLGVLYGAGATSSLDRNRLWARWLQHKTVFVAEDGKRYEPVASMGPDRQFLSLPKGEKAKGHFEFFAEDGVTPLGKSDPLTIASGNLYQVDPSTDDDGFVNLIDENLSHWEGMAGGAPQGWICQNGVLTFKGEGDSIKLKGNDYGDFLLQFEYKLPVAGNSGVFIRQPKEFSAMEAIEIQVLDHNADQYKGKIKDSQHTASIYAVVPAAKDVIHPAGEWNSMEILCLGSRIRTKLNGELMTDADVDTYTELKNRPRRGGFGLQNHGSTLEYRNMRMKRLD